MEGSTKKAGAVIGVIATALIGAIGSYEKAKIQAEEDYNKAKLGVETLSASVNKLADREDALQRDVDTLKGHIAAQNVLIAAALTGRPLPPLQPITLPLPSPSPPQPLAPSLRPLLPLRPSAPLTLRNLGAMGGGQGAGMAASAPAAAVAPPTFTRAPAGLTRVSRLEQLTKPIVVNHDFVDRLNAMALDPALKSNAPAPAPRRLPENLDELVRAKK